MKCFTHGARTCEAKGREGQGEPESGVPGSGRQQEGRGRLGGRWGPHMVPSLLLRLHVHHGTGFPAPPPWEGKEMGGQVGKQRSFLPRVNLRFPK